VTIFYDAGCSGCTWIAATLVRAGRGALRAAAIDSAEGEQRLTALDPATRAGSWHALDQSGELHSGGSAAPLVLECLPVLAVLAPLTRALPRLTDRAYVLVATTRSRWGRLLPSSWIERARDELDRRES
jgi:predicted DCC family thiol-disulfide oxidoreductase YuxK